MSAFTAYKILGGHPGMSQEELKALHRTLSQKLHPDRRGGDLPSFLELQGAWRLVRDTDARRILAVRLQGLGDRCENCKGRGYRIHQRKFVTIGKVACDQCGACGYTPRT